MLLIPQLLCLLGVALGTMHANPLAEVKLERGDCPMSWLSYNVRCYKYVGTPMTWSEAEMNCVSQDGNLVSIHSGAEHDYVLHLIQKYDPSNEYTWNGLSDLHSDGKWMWSDGSKVSHTMWWPGEPNGGDQHNCVVVNYKSRWADTACSRHYRSVCALLVQSSVQFSLNEQAV